MNQILIIFRAIAVVVFLALCQATSDVVEDYVIDYTLLGSELGHQNVSVMFFQGARFQLNRSLNTLFVQIVVLEGGDELASELMKDDLGDEARLTQHSRHF